MTGFNAGLSHVVSWIVRLAVLNVYGIIASLAGLIVLGVFPAVVSMCAVIRQWILGLEEERSFSKMFWYTYKHSFFSANVIGWTLAAAGCLLYIDFRFLQELTGIFHTVMAFVFVTITCVYMTVVLYIFPVYVHYDIKRFQTFKYALIIGISSPLATIFMAAVVVTVCLATAFYSALLPFFSFSFLFYGLMICALYTFQKISKRDTDSSVFSEKQARL